MNEKGWIGGLYLKLLECRVVVKSRETVKETRSGNLVCKLCSDATRRMLRSWGLTFLLLGRQLTDWYILSTCMENYEMLVSVKSFLN